MRAIIGEFEYDDPTFEEQLGAREKRPMVLMENGARYIGEWLLSNKIREGKGM